MSLEHSPAKGRCAFRIAEFCEAHSISRSMLYKEWAAGRGPRFKEVGTIRLISAEAANEWRNQSE
jgi:hypothetical protein